MVIDETRAIGTVMSWPDMRLPVYVPSGTQPSC
jgi:hypothetical protein